MDFVRSVDVIYNVLEEYLQKDKTSVYILKPCREKSQNLQENSHGGKLGGKLVKKLGI